MDESVLEREPTDRNQEFPSVDDLKLCESLEILYPVRVVL